MRYIYFDPETRLGYIMDPLTPEEAEGIAIGIGYYMLINIVAALITAIAIFPFFIVSGLDKFLISFYSVNKNFIIGTTTVLILTKFFTIRLSTTLIIRFLFSIIIIVPTLYILLYKFHMAEITISIGKRFELTQHFLKNTTIQSAWFEALMNNIFGVLSKAFFYIIHAGESIDYSAFSSSLSTINIVSVLICIGKAVWWWGLLILFCIALFIIGLIAIVIIIGFPYFIAFFVLMLVNNVIYRVKLNYVRYLKF